MIDEYSFGIVPLRKKKQWQVFLVQHKNGLFWSFPKGHSVKNEDPQNVAKRELKEETNLDVNHFLFSDPFIETYSYVKNGKTQNKQVTYFPAIVSGRVQLQKEEIIDGKWLNLEDAILLLTYDQSKEVLKKVKKNCYSDF